MEHLSRLPVVHRGALMTEPDDNRSPDVFTRKWLLVVLLCMVPSFFSFALLGDPGRGRAAAICVGVGMTVTRACWNSRTHAWFWIVLAVMITLHVFLVLSVPWNDKSYPGYALLPVAVLDYGFMYGCIKLVEKIVRRSAGVNSPN
jgi:hypothetical protein